MKILLKNATLIDEKSAFHNQKIDVLIEDGLISKIDTQIKSKVDQKIEFINLHLSAGWFDPCISFGEPGYEERETLDVGLQTAAKSGFTHILLNPNTDPVLDTFASVNNLLQRSSEFTTQLHCSGVLSSQAKGLQMTSLYDLHRAGAKAFGDFNKGITNPNLLRIALDYSQTFGGIIQSYPIDESLANKGQMHEGTVSTNLGLKGITEVAETTPLARDLQLLEYTGGKMHVPFLSSAESVDLIRKAKKQGLNVSASVGIAHLVFTHEELMDFNPNFKVIPPLRRKEDQQALREGLLEGTIDMVSSLHQPVNKELKDLEFVQSKEGSIGLEASFRVLQNQFPLEKTIAFLTRGKKLFGIENPVFKEGIPADLSLFSPNGSGTFSTKDILSTSKNCMFIDTPTKGTVYGCIRGEKIQLNK